MLADGETLLSRWANTAHKSICQWLSARIYIYTGIKEWRRALLTSLEEYKVASLFILPEVCGLQPPLWAVTYKRVHSFKPEENAPVCIGGYNQTAVLGNVYVCYLKSENTENVSSWSVLKNFCFFKRCYHRLIVSAAILETFMMRTHISFC